MLTVRHDKEGYFDLAASDVPLLAQSSHSYALVFTKVGQIVFIAIYKKDAPQLTTIVDVYA